VLKWFRDNNMKVNCNKFQYMIFGNCNDENDHIDVEGNTIHAQKVVKLLGVYIDVNLNFDLHVNEICKKAGRKLNVLRLSRNLDEQSKLILFHSFIMSNFEYCSIVWHFCSKDNMVKIEKIQK
jgi:hypothetical protein